ncbi:MAG TPA: sigma-70 family RNA polymerase sigma factor [Trebonia sp.]|nr:sigma-70 family RNA polymerase sigma factor [Trebonia sp.]
MTGVRGEGPGEANGQGRGGGDQDSVESGDAWLAERFEQNRGRLRAVAYRMLGSLEEADDAVQEAWVRFAAAGADGVENLAGWLTTIVTRVCLNVLRARAARPETLAGPWIPDPVLSPADGPTPEQEALLADSVGLAMLVVLDTLTPAERVAFVLHDVFDVPFGEIAPMLGRTPEASRQLASRARQRVRTAGTHEPDGTLAAQRAVIDAFFAAARAGDLATLVELLHPDVVLRTDGFVAGSALLRGADTVARATLGGARPEAEFRPVVVNGVAGVLVTLRGRPAGLMAFTIVGGRITAVDGITDPRRLRRLVAAHGLDDPPDQPDAAEQPADPDQP